jgi:hypothetical protein
MTQSTRIYKHSAAGTDWAALALGAGLGLTLALQATTLRSGDFKDFYSVVVTVSRLAVMVGGQDSAKWFGQPELQGYQVFAVNRHEQTAWSI